MPDGIKVSANNRTEIKLKVLINNLLVRSCKDKIFRPPEPYKGKGIRYKGEHVRSKQGKTVGAK